MNRYLAIKIGPPRTEIIRNYIYLIWLSVTDIAASPVKIMNIRVFFLN